LLRVQRGELGEVRTVLRLLRAATVHGLHPDQRVELLASLPLPRGTQHAGDDVALAQAELLHQRQRDVGVLGAGQVTRPADEGIVVEHVEDAAHRHQHVVLGDRRLAVHPLAAAAVAATLPVAIPPPSPTPSAATLVTVVPVVVPAVPVVTAVVTALASPVLTTRVLVAPVLVAPVGAVIRAHFALQSRADSGGDVGRHAASVRNGIVLLRVAGLVPSSATFFLLGALLLLLAAGFVLLVAGFVPIVARLV